MTHGNVGSRAARSVHAFVYAFYIDRRHRDPSIGFDDVEPILEEHCVTCHGGTPGGPWPLTSHEHVASWANEIRSQMSSCGMPPADTGSTITTDERERLLLWVRCGAKE